MSEHCEEQEMEAEALQAIFMEAFEVLESTQPFKWSIKLMPVDCGGDEKEEEKENHVAIKLIATIPLEYPEVSLPQFEVEVIKGLAGDQVKEITSLANEEAEANAGMPAIFAVCEAVRAWLAENNVKGLDDGSMHAQMMRKMKEAEKAKVSGRRIDSIHCLCNLLRLYFPSSFRDCVVVSQVSCCRSLFCRWRMLVKDLQYRLYVLCY